MMPHVQQFPILARWGFFFRVVVRLCGWGCAFGECSRGLVNFSRGAGFGFGNAYTYFIVLLFSRWEHSMNLFCLGAGLLECLSSLLNLCRPTELATEFGS